MARVFVSHASADSEYAKTFVNYLLRIGCGLDPETLFFSSERDTGVPSGADLMASVREEVDEATLVIALITPMYQVRPVCIAELGAAWARSDKFFPLLAPSMSREDLEGVIPSTLIQRAGDSDVLDELFDRVCSALGESKKAATWGVGKQKWLSYVGSGRLDLKFPEIHSADEVAALRRELDETKAALDYTEQQVQDLLEQCSALAGATTDLERREILLPKADKARFEALQSEARNSLHPFSRVVREAIYQGLRGEAICYPNRYDEPDEARDLDDAIERNLVFEGDTEGSYHPNPDKRRVGEAIRAVEALKKFLGSDDREPAFAEWFVAEFDVEPTLSDRDCWEALLD